MSTQKKHLIETVILRVTITWPPGYKKNHDHSQSEHEISIAHKKLKC